MLVVGAFDQHPHLLATGAAVSGIFGSAGRAVGPAISGYLYSLSTQFETWTWGRQISWLSFLALSIPIVVCCRFLPRDDSKNGREQEGAPFLGEEDGDD